MESRILKTIPNTHKQIIASLNGVNIESDKIPINEKITVESLIKYLSKKRLYISVTADILEVNGEGQPVAIQIGGMSLKDLL